jgi:hypothetical protein
VLGIDMPSTPLEMRRELWEEVIRELLRAAGVRQHPLANGIHLLNKGAKFFSL